MTVALRSAAAVVLATLAVSAGACGSPRQAMGTTLIISGTMMGGLGAVAMSDSGDSGDYDDGYSHSWDVDDELAAGERFAGGALLVGGVVALVGGLILHGTASEDEEPEARPQPVLADAQLCARLDTLIAEERDPEQRTVLLVERTRLCYQERRVQP